MDIATLPKRSYTATLAPPGQRLVGLLYVPADYSAPRSGMRHAWRRHVVANAAVRDADYMRSAFEDLFPGAELLVTVDGTVPDGAVRADTVVLLYPDAIGIDFEGIESALRAAAPGRRLLALNGRRRVFRLDAPTQQRLRRKRRLERVRLLEAVLVAGMLLVTPVLWLWDFARGHR